jgi:hypothetical protein
VRPGVKEGGESALGERGMAGRRAALRVLLCSALALADCARVAGLSKRLKAEGYWARHTEAGHVRTKQLHAEPEVTTSKLSLRKAGRGQNHEALLRRAAAVARRGC